jgi:hypothetical protein
MKAPTKRHLLPTAVGRSGGGMSRRTARRTMPLTAAVMAACVGLLAGGCAELPLETTAHADLAARDEGLIAAVEERLAAMDDFVARHNGVSGSESWDMVGRSYTIALIDGEVWQNLSIDVAAMGQPVAASMAAGGQHARTAIHTYHPAGSDEDYHLLGDDLRDLSPTPWVATSTLYPPVRIDKDIALERDPYNWTFCLSSSYLVLCGIRGSIFKALSHPSAGDAQPKVTDLGDGTTLLSITVPCWTLSTVSDFPGYAPIIRTSGLALVEYLLANDMADQPVLVRLWQTAEGEPIKAEINGEMSTGEQQMAIQAGWEKTGTATAEDFPKAPSALDVSHLTDEEYDALMVKIQERRDELAGS